LLTERTMNRLHARVLEEGGTREALKLARGFDYTG
jgi:hypothetical protein